MIDDDVSRGFGHALWWMIGEPHVNVAHIPPPTNHWPRERPVTPLACHPRMNAPHRHTTPISDLANVQQTPPNRPTILAAHLSPVHSSDTIHRHPFAAWIFTTQSCSSNTLHHFTTES
jgi:hypothetical protein